MEKRLYYKIWGTNEKKVFWYRFHEEKKLTIKTSVKIQFFRENIYVSRMRMMEISLWAFTLEITT